MKPTRDEIHAHVMQVLATLSEDGEVMEEITDETRMLGDMNWSSINFVVLANATQQHYQLSFPFADLLAGSSQGGTYDISVGEWVDFVHDHWDSAEPLKPEPDELNL